MKTRYIKIENFKNNTFFTSLLPIGVLYVGEEFSGSFYVVPSYEVEKMILVGTARKGLLEGMMLTGVSRNLSILLKLRVAGSGTLEATSFYVVETLFREICGYEDEVCRV